MLCCRLVAILARCVVGIATAMGHARVTMVARERRSSPQDLRIRREASDLAIAVRGRPPPLQHRFVRLARHRVVCRFIQAAVAINSVSTACGASEGLLDALMHSRGPTAVVIEIVFGIIRVIFFVEGLRMVVVVGGDSALLLRLKAALDLRLVCGLLIRGELHSVGVQARGAQLRCLDFVRNTIC